MYRKHPTHDIHETDKFCASKLLTNFGRICPEFNCPCPKPMCCNGNGARSANFDCNNLNKVLTYSDTIFDMKKGESTSIAIPFSIPLKCTTATGNHHGLNPYTTIVKYSRCPNDNARCCCGEDCGYVPSPNAVFEVGSASVRILSIRPKDPLTTESVKVNCTSLFSDQALDEISPNFYQLRLGNFTPEVNNNQCPCSAGMCASITINPFQLQYVFEYTFCGTVIDGCKSYRFYIKSINCDPLNTSNSVYNYIKGICIPKQATIYPPYVDISFGYTANIIDCVQIDKEHPIVTPPHFDCCDTCGCDHHGAHDTFFDNTEADFFNCNCGTTASTSFEDDLMDNFMDGGCDTGTTTGTIVPPTPVAGDFVITGVTSVNPVVYAESVLPQRTLTLGNIIDDRRFPRNTGCCHNTKNRWK